MEDTSKNSLGWAPLQWFLEGWHDVFDERSIASNPEGYKTAELVFGPSFLQPGWIKELESIRETGYPEALHRVTEVLIPGIDRWIREERDLDGCGNFLRGCAAYGIVTKNYFHGRITLPGYSCFIERIRAQLYEAGVRLAEQELANRIDPRKVKKQLIVITPNGIEHRQELDNYQNSRPFIAELDFPTPHSLILELGPGGQVAYIRAHDGLILEYQIGLGNFFALGCSSTGRFNPFGLGVEELWRSQRYFPLIGSLAAPTEEIENGLSWWRITNPQVAPLDVMVPSSRY